MKRAIESILAGMAFLTIVPVPAGVQADSGKVADSIVFFPVCGLILGAFAAAVNFLLSQILPASLSDALTLLSLFLVTGGLHTDGLADTFDGVLSGRGEEGVREIMKDSRLGAHGAVILFFVLLIKYLSIQAILPDHKTGAIILMTTAGRWSVLVVAFRSPYDPGQGGLGSLFITNMTGVHLIKATLFLLPISFLCVGFVSGIILTVAVTATSALMAALAIKRAGRVSGDTFGATIELCEMVTLICVAALIQAQA